MKRCKGCLSKSYSDFAEEVGFSYWWSCIGKGQRAACNAGWVFGYLHFPTEMCRSFLLFLFLSVRFSGTLMTGQPATAALLQAADEPTHESHVIVVSRVQCAKCSVH